MDVNKTEFKRFKQFNQFKRFKCLKQMKQFQYIFLIFVSVLLFGCTVMSSLPMVTVTARAAEEEDDEAETGDEEAVLPEGPQNDLEIRASEQGVAWPVGPDALWSDKAILIDLDTGVALYEKNADAQDFPASTTKIMTAMLVLENASMDDVVTFSADAVNKTEGSGIWRMEGEQLTVEQCMYALMLASANECAYALAEYVTGGDHDAFVQMMNDRAAVLGCENTHFTNTNGLPDEEHVTTARDLAKIARAAYQNETFRQIAGTEEYRIPATNMQDEEVLMYNHHKMICGKKTDKYLYEPATAGKTGYTKDALHTLVTFAEKDGKRLAVVVLRSTGDAQYTETQDLFEYGFANFINLNISENETRLDQSALTEGYTVPEGRQVTDAQIDPNAMLTLPVDVSISDTTAEVVYETAEDGSQTGDVIYTYGGNEVGRAEILITSEEVKPAQEVFSSAEEEIENAASDGGMTDRITALLKDPELQKKLLIPVVVVIVIIVVLVLAIRRAIRRHRQKKILAKVKTSEAPVLEEVEDLNFSESSEPDGEEDDILTEETEAREDPGTAGEIRTEETETAEEPDAGGEIRKPEQDSGAPDEDIEK